MAVRRQQVITLNVPISGLAQNVSDVLRGNPRYMNLWVREDMQEFTCTTALTLWVFPLNWSIQLSSQGTQTLVTVANASLPFVIADVMNIQNRYITEFLRSLEREAGQPEADQTLLRASAAPPAKSDTLLRPIDPSTATAKEELLRPDQHRKGL